MHARVQKWQNKASVCLFYQPVSVALQQIRQWLTYTTCIVLYHVQLQLEYMYTILCSIAAAVGIETIEIFIPIRVAVEAYL